MSDVPVVLLGPGLAVWSLSPAARNHTGRRTGREVGEWRDRETGRQMGTEGKEKGLCTDKEQC